MDPLDNLPIRDTINKLKNQFKAITHILGLIINKQERNNYLNSFLRCEVLSINSLYVFFSKSTCFVIMLDKISKPFVKQ